MKTKRPKIAVIGAGWAGLSAAVSLIHRADISLFEAGRQAGGRARSIAGKDGGFSNFWTLSLHGLNPNSQVFKAIRFLRGEGIAIL